MTHIWTPVREKDRLAVVIHKFEQPELNHRLQLSIGECVEIQSELGEWYYGVSLKNRALNGIFPRSFVHILESIVDKSGPTEVVVPKQPHIVHELTSVLREWGVLWKQLYATNSEHFTTIECKLYELIRIRSKILSGTLPVDELKQMKRIASSKIDMGNKLLGLDLVVRDEHGNILNPEHTSTIQLYWHHAHTAERIRRATIDASSKRSSRPLIPQYSHALFVSLRRFNCKMTDDMELLVMLYDAKEGKPFTESFVVRWSKDVFSKDVDMLPNNLRALFTDLGCRDLKREKVYLVCYVVHVGGMDICKDNDNKRSARSGVNKATVPVIEPVRRPYGVAALDISLFLIGRLESDEDKIHYLPFLHCEKDDSLEGTLKRVLSLKDFPQKEHKSQNLTASLKLLHGDMKQVREENPHLVMGQVAIARKMGFPEVILPGDVRNDLYLTLLSGEFSKGSKSTDKNVEVTVRVFNEKGCLIRNVIVLGGGVNPQNEYRSMVYYHEDKPKWNETFKIAIPIEEFKTCHLKFTFKHRSSNETKDKNEKPFAMSYVKLMQEDGTTLKDTTHEILVYKIDHKKFDPQDLSYLNLPSTRAELIEGVKPSVQGLSFTNKDSFLIHTNVCSTKLTQNVDLLGLLNWANDSDNLSSCLLALMKVDGEEIVKFLQDVLDALFNILMQNPDSDVFDNMVFDCLLYIISLVSDLKYQHFQPVLDLYIKESFCATLAYSKLMVVLKCHIDNAKTSDKDVLLKTMKCMQYCIRFVVRSRLLFIELYEGKGQQQFELQMQQLLQSIAAMMYDNTDSTLVIQGACLKYLPSTIPDIITVFNPIQLSSLLMDLVTNVPTGRLTKQKMMTISDIVHSKLFLDAECRAVMLPVIMARIRELLELHDEACSRIEFRNKIKSEAKIVKVLGTAEAKLHEPQGFIEEVELCVKILSDIMDLLFREDPGNKDRDISEIMLSMLRTVIQTTIKMNRESHLIGNLVAVMISIFRQMTAFHFEDYIGHFPTRTDLLDFLMEILLVFKDLVSTPVYPNDWCEMIMLENSVILKALTLFSHTIRDEFSVNFEYQAWNIFFSCAIAFLTQPALQLEYFNSNKRWRIISRYKDMRRETGFEIRSMWFNLGQHKKSFLPCLVGPFLEMTLIPETELRKATIPIFFDMMQCEFYSPRDGNLELRRDSTHIKGKFTEFENEMIAKLDHLVEGGKGDAQYKDMFYNIMMSHCENHSSLKDIGPRFVKMIRRLMERLLEYRCVITDENKENRMSCTVSLLDFYSEINRKEMYIRYVNKLCDLQLESDNFTEAAYTLRLHSKLLSWSNDELTPLLRSPRYPQLLSHRQLKDALYRDMVNYFDKGKNWECALSICKELVKQYEEEIFDYHLLSDLLRRMSNFYDSIMKQLRPEPEYFRVGYYGRGFPPFLQNKVFIYRGKEYEHLSDFCVRTLNQFPNAELMNRLSSPGKECTESQFQYIQINKVEPVMDEKKKRLSGRLINDQILRYYRVNDVQKFRFSRPYHKRDSRGEDSSGVDHANEFATLWVERTVLVTSYPLPGILRWFPVTAVNTFHMSPLQNAIEAMENANKTLRDLIISHSNDSTLSLNNLTMKLQGMIDANVMGGISNYEKAFFTPDYLENNPKDCDMIAQLKDHIASQIPLLEIAIKVHGDRVPASQAPLHNHLKERFNDLSSHVIKNYGKKTSDLKFEPASIRRQLSSTQVLNSENRNSNTSLGSIEGSGSRVSSLTRSQVAGLKSFVNFSSTGSLTRANSNSSTSPMKTPSGTLKKDKKRRSTRSISKASDRESTSSWTSLTSTASTATLISNSQWYTQPEPPSPPMFDAPPTLPALITPTTPIFELRQELTPKRPLRSEVEKEKRMSRPASGQFSPQKPAPGGINGSGSNRDSIGTYDSTASEEDNTPPALPLKQRESDYCNIDDHSPSSPCTPSTPRVRNKPPPPEPIESDTPPTPPPKRPHLKSPES